MVTTPSKKSSKLLIIVGLSGLALAGAAYGVGLLQGGARVSGIQQEMADAESRHRVELDAARDALDEATRRSRLLDASRQIHMALHSMDDRNFGIAQQHLRLAARLLINSGKGAEVTRIRSIMEQVQAIQVVAADDFREQRLDVRRVASGLDDMIATPVLTETTTPNDFDEAHARARRLARDLDEQLPPAAPREWEEEPVGAGAEGPVGEQSQPVHEDGVEPAPQLEEPDPSQEWQEEDPEASADWPSDEAP